MSHEMSDLELARICSSQDESPNFGEFVGLIGEDAISSDELKELIAREYHDPEEVLDKIRKTKEPVVEGTTSYYNCAVISQQFKISVVPCNLVEKVLIEDFKQSVKLLLFEQNPGSYGRTCRLFSFYSYLSYNFVEVVFNLIACQLRALLEQNLTTWLKRTDQLTQVNRLLGLMISLFAHRKKAPEIVWDLFERIRERSKEDKVFLLDVEQLQTLANASRDSNLHYSLEEHFKKQSAVLELSENMRLLSDNPIPFKTVNIVVYWMTRYPEIVFDRLLSILGDDVVNGLSNALNFVKLIYLDFSLSGFLEKNKDYAEDFSNSFDSWFIENKITLAHTRHESETSWNFLCRDGSVDAFLTRYCTFAENTNVWGLLRRRCCLAVLVSRKVDSIMFDRDEFKKRVLVTTSYDLDERPRRPVRNEDYNSSEEEDDESSDRTSDQDSSDISDDSYDSDDPTPFEIPFDQRVLHEVYQENWQQREITRCFHSLGSLNTGYHRDFEEPVTVGGEWQEAYYLASDTDSENPDPYGGAYDYGEAPPNFPTYDEYASLPATYTRWHLERENVYLLWSLAELIHHDEICAGDFLCEMYRCLEDPVIKQTGACWYALQGCLKDCRGLQELVKQPVHAKTIWNAFSKNIDSLLSIGTVEMYFSKLQQFLPDTEIIMSLKKTKSIDYNRKRVEERRLAEETFSRYFYLSVENYRSKRLGNPKDPNFKMFLRLVEKWSFPFIGVFLNRLLSLLPQKNDKEAEIDWCLTLFRHCLSKSYKLRRMFYKESFLSNIATAFDWNFRTALENKIHDLFTLPFTEIHAKEIIGKTLIKRFKESDVKEIKQLAQSGEADIHLVAISSYSFPVVAKYFHRDMIDHLTEELDVLMRLQSHPHIVHPYGYIMIDGDYNGILMEHCKGGSLWNFIKKYPFHYGEQDAISWLEQAASGLHYLHENNIFHRDVKPANMLLVDDLASPMTREKCPKHLKVTDFGMAKAFNNRTPAEYNATYSCHGTDGFRAPEVEEDDDFTTAMDVYSFGRSVWQVYFQEMPTDDKVEDNWKKPRIRMLESLSDLMRKMMRDEPHKRPRIETIFDALKEMKRRHAKALSKKIVRRSSR